MTGGVLMSCILFFTFDYLANRCYNGMNLVHGGLKLLRQWEVLSYNKFMLGVGRFKDQVSSLRSKVQSRNKSEKSSGSGGWSDSVWLGDQKKIPEHDDERP
jgi:hypothetical protein